MNIILKAKNNHEFSLSLSVLKPRFCCWCFEVSWSGQCFFMVFFLVLTSVRMARNSKPLKNTQQLMNFWFWYILRKS